MKKKFILLNILLLALVFSSCNLGNSCDAQMTILNDSETETISSIEVSFFAANSKEILIHDALDDGESVAPGEKVVFNLPNLANYSYLFLGVFIDNDDNTKTKETQIDYDDGANFTVKYKGFSTDPAFDSFVIEEGQNAEIAVLD